MCFLLCIICVLFCLIVCFMIRFTVHFMFYYVGANDSRSVIQIVTLTCLGPLLLPFGDYITLDNVNQLFMFLHLRLFNGKILCEQSCLA